jgi:hypothetical protein
MLFTTLSSEVIKAGLVSRFAFSLGFKLIAAAQKANRPAVVDPLSGEMDYTPQDNLKHAKRSWAIFKEFAETHNYPISTLAEIAIAYAKSTNKPVVSASDDMIALRAKVSGISLSALKDRETKERIIAVARQQEALHKLISDLDDMVNYTNAWYENQTGVEGDTEGTMEEDDVIPDAWVNDTYPKILKSQIAFWTKYNNWDDAEVCMIAADQELLK